ncbi:MAG: hypothetical protein WBM41_01600 [Arenicellales bacterium]|jgi:hypothetical protein
MPTMIVVGELEAIYNTSRLLILIGLVARRITFWGMYPENSEIDRGTDIPDSLYVDPWYGKNFDDDF